MTTEEKIDRIYDIVFQISNDMSSLKTWKVDHVAQHERESTWKRWVIPTFISLGSIATTIILFVIKK